MVTCLLPLLFLWRETTGFVATARASARCRPRSYSGSNPLSVSTQTEEELRDKLARDNEDLSEVRTVALERPTTCNGGAFS